MDPAWPLASVRCCQRSVLQQGQLAFQSYPLWNPCWAAKIAKSSLSWQAPRMQLEPREGRAQCLEVQMPGQGCSGSLGEASSSPKSPGHPRASSTRWTTAQWCDCPHTWVWYYLWWKNSLCFLAEKGSNSLLWVKKINKMHRLLSS